MVVLGQASAGLHPKYLCERTDIAFWIMSFPCIVVVKDGKNHLCESSLQLFTLYHFLESRRYAPGRVSEGATAPGAKDYRIVVVTEGQFEESSEFRLC